MRRLIQPSLFLAAVAAVAGPSSAQVAKSGDVVVMRQVISKPVHAPAPADPVPQVRNSDFSQPIDPQLNWKSSGDGAVTQSGTSGRVFANTTMNMSQEIDDVIPGRSYEVSFRYWANYNRGPISVSFSGVGASVPLNTEWSTFKHVFTPKSENPTLIFSVIRDKTKNYQILYIDDITITSAQ